MCIIKDQKLHCLMKPNQYEVTTHLQMTPKGGGGLNLRDSLAKFLEQYVIKKIGSNIFIVDKFCKKCTCKIRDFKTVKQVYM